MNRATATQASNLALNQTLKEQSEEGQIKKCTSLYLTPQRHNETFRKKIYEERVSRTDDKRILGIDFGPRRLYPFQEGLFSDLIYKEIKYTGCNCRKSQCLKMYCTCFAVGKMCDETCLCDSCKNDLDNMDRSQAINEIIQKDPFAFSKKADMPNANFQDDFCNCRKSNCKKKYCDCYRRGKVCGSKCNCVDCQNCSGHQDLQKNSDSGPKKKSKLQE